MFENRALRNIFGPKRDEARGQWRRLHYEELYDLCSSLNIIRLIKSRRMRWVGHVARMGDRRGAYRVSVERPKRKRPLGRPTHKYENNIKKDQEVGWGAWIRLICLRKGTVGGACECGNETSGSIKCRESLLTENPLASQEGLCFMES